MTGVNVGGLTLNLSQLEAELAAEGVSVNGLTTLGPDQEMPRAPEDVAHPSGTVLFTHDNQGALVDLPTGAESVVSAHVPMRDKTDAEYAAEYQDSATTAQRRQQINAIMTGLLPRDQVPM